MRARREKRQAKKNKIRNIMRIIITFLILGTIIYIVYGVYNESKIKFVQEEKNDIQEKYSRISTETIIIDDKHKLERKVPETYLNYKVSARIEIPKLNIDSNVLEEYSKEGLEECVSKYWGPEPNEVGNYCIAGHNYGRKNMFGYLGDLEIGDKIYLSDNKNGKYTYSIYEMYRVEADNTNPLNQVTNGKREITLITCSSYSEKRLIVKAVEE